MKPPIGSIIRHKVTGDAYMVSEHGALGVIVTRSLYAQNPTEWEVVWSPVETSGGSAPWARWPLGLNREMDEHAASNGLAHWSCTSVSNNECWIRVDGLTVNWLQSYRKYHTYVELLGEMDRENPLEVKR